MTPKQLPELFYKDCKLKFYEPDGYGMYQKIEYICPITPKMRREIGYPDVSRSIRGVITVYPVLDVVERELR